MKHNISIYDTGRIGTYSRRNEGFVMASVIAGVILAVSGAVMIMAGFLDPAVPVGVAFAGILVFLVPALNGLMFLNHRNFGLGVSSTQAMDAIYSLPKDERKQYRITRDEVKALSPAEVNRLVYAVEDYRSNRTAGNSIGTLTANLIEYNKTYREIEGTH